MEKILIDAKRVMAKCGGICDKTLRRWVEERRFPPSVNPKGHKRFWALETVENWIADRQQPIEAAVVVPAKKQKRKQEEFQQRQANAAAVLARHGGNTGNGEGGVK